MLAFLVVWAFTGAAVLLFSALLAGFGVLYVGLYTDL
jgi:archaellum component FlaF (FlaF/FlaG flagellin family)